MGRGGESRGSDGQSRHELRGIAYSALAAPTTEVDDEWSHPLVRRQRMNLEQSLLVAILRQQFVMMLDIFDAHAALSAVVEPSPAAESPPIALTESESMLYRHLYTLERGRLEQEFLSVDDEDVGRACRTTDRTPLHFRQLIPLQSAGCRWRTPGE